MKKLTILILLLSLSITAQDKGWLFLENDAIRLDHQSHIVASMGLSVPVYIMYETNPNINEPEAMIYTFGTVTTLGLFKEFTDASGFDFTDIGANTVGCLVGVATAYLLRKKAKKYLTREQKELKRLKLLDK